MRLTKNEKETSFSAAYFTASIDLFRFLSAMPFKTANIDIMYGEGVSKEGELVDLASEVSESEILYDEIKDIALKYSIDDYVEIAIDAEQYRYIAIEIKGSVLFQLGKAELKEEAKPLMSKVADMLKEYSGYRIEVIGHTDNVPCTSAPYYSNEMLSAARAINVARYMAETKEIGWENVFYSGRGEYEPIASNDTEEGRRKNRRVEIRLYNKKNSTN